MATRKFQRMFGVAAFVCVLLASRAVDHEWIVGAGDRGIYTEFLLGTQTGKQNGPLMWIHTGAPSARHSVLVQPTAAATTLADQTILDNPGTVSTGSERGYKTLVRQYPRGYTHSSRHPSLVMFFTFNIAHRIHGASGSLGIAPTEATPFFFLRYTQMDLTAWRAAFSFASDERCDGPDQIRCTATPGALCGYNISVSGSSLTVSFWDDRVFPEENTVQAGALAYRELLSACQNKGKVGLFSTSTSCSAVLNNDIGPLQIVVPWSAIQLPLTASMLTPQPTQGFPQLCVTTKLKRYHSIIPELGEGFTIPAFVVVALVSFVSIVLYFHIGNTLIPMNRYAYGLMKITCVDLPQRRRHLDSIIAIQFLTLLFIVLLMGADALWYDGPFSSRGNIDETETFSYVLVVLLVANFIVLNIARNRPTNSHYKPENETRAILISLLRTQLMCDMVCSASIVYMPYVLHGVALVAGLTLVIGYRCVVSAGMLARTVSVRLLVHDMAIMCQDGDRHGPDTVSNVTLLTIFVLLENFIVGIVFHILITYPIVEGFAPVYGAESFHLIFFMLVTRSFSNIQVDSLFTGNVAVALHQNLKKL